MKKIIVQFKYSQELIRSLDLYIKTERQNNNFLHKLVLDNATRWNSTANMFFNFLALKNGIISISSISTSEVLKNNILTEDEWKIISLLCEIFDIFKISTIILQSQSYITVSHIMSFIFYFRLKLQSFISSCTMSIISKAVSKDLEKLEKYFPKNQYSFYYYYSYLLDPRFKTEGLIKLKYNNKEIEKIKNCFIKQYNRYVNFY